MGWAVIAILVIDMLSNILYAVSLTIRPHFTKILARVTRYYQRRAEEKTKMNDEKETPKRL